MTSAEYQDLCARALVVLERPGPPDIEAMPPKGERLLALTNAAGALSRATAGHPEGAQGWTLFGRAALALGWDGQALQALKKARQLGASDSKGSLALALLLARNGELEPALGLYRRLLRDGKGPLLLRRTGDVLMALGRLEEAIPLYRQACAVPRQSDGWYRRIEVARGCYGLAVALDRAERLGDASLAMRQAVALDPTQRSFDLHGAGIGPGGDDFVPPGDRDYYKVLVNARHGTPCEELAALRAYLGPASPGGGGGPGSGDADGPTYAGRARARLERLVSLCDAEYSILPYEPLGSHQDRDGGRSWPTPADVAAKSPT